MDQLTWHVGEIDGRKLILKKMKFTLTIEVESHDPESLGHLINPRQKVMVAETPKGIALSFTIKGDKHYQILERASMNTFRIRTKDNDGIKWDVISTGSRDSLKLERKARDNDGYRPKCILMLVKVLFLWAIVVVSVFFYYKKEQC
jgi:hypothetical protein